MAILTNEYQCLGVSNAIESNTPSVYYYVLLYAKATKNNSTGKYTVTVKQRLACKSSMSFYGFSSSAYIQVNGTDVVKWDYENEPNVAWSSNLVEGGVTYSLYVDLREGSIEVAGNNLSATDISIDSSWVFKKSQSSTDPLYLPVKDVYATVTTTATLPAMAQGVVYIDNGSGWDAYQVYIDNGSSWDLYVPYIDNGSSWDLYGG